MPVREQWNGKLSRVEAVRILDRATDQDDPFWEHVVEDHYDEKADNMPTIMDVLAASFAYTKRQNRSDFHDRTGSICGVARNHKAAVAYYP